MLANATSPYAPDVRAAEVGAHDPAQHPRAIDKHLDQAADCQAGTVAAREPQGGLALVVDADRVNDRTSGHPTESKRVDAYGVKTRGFLEALTKKPSTAFELHCIAGHKSNVYAFLSYLERRGYVRATGERRAKPNRGGGQPGRVWQITTAGRKALEEINAQSKLPRPSKRTDSPSFVRWRLHRANVARRRKAWFRRESLGDRYASKGLAYAAGDRAGYVRAIRWVTYQLRHGRFKALNPATIDALKAFLKERG